MSELKNIINNNNYTISNTQLRYIEFIFKVLCVQNNNIPVENKKDTSILYYEYIDLIQICTKDTLCLIFKNNDDLEGFFEIPKTYSFNKIIKTITEESKTIIPINKANIKENGRISMKLFSQLIPFCQSHKYNKLILVVDSMKKGPDQHLKAYNLSPKVIHFTPKECNINCFGKHVFQPMKMYKVDQTKYKQQDMFIGEVEYSDILIRYYGFNIGDLICTEYTDKQVGIVKEFYKVVVPISEYK